MCPDEDPPPPPPSAATAVNHPGGPETDPVADDAPPSTRASTATGDRYQVGSRIGVGGMGEVLLARDQQIGREVAIKRIRDNPSPSAEARFLREARIQGRLEHPAIVPVHELSVDERGRPFFVMKRLTGTTLASLLMDERVAGRPPTNRQRLLRAFVDVCLAIEFAHQRGVVHRDLKPSNIMLGDFGEVYVLDWGVARVVGDDTGEPGAVASTPGPHGPDSQKPSWPDADLAGTTRAGSILGTPGYIPPEQLRGERRLDHRADVFALGCILFEILAGEALLPHGAPALEVDYAALDARPSRRAPGRELAPELDQICVVATRAERDQRYPTARALAEAVERYLDGDRDLALRRRLASEHLAAAQRAHDRGDDVEARRRAMSEAGRALALDPGAAEAAALVGRLMLEPPRVTPPEVQDELRALDASDTRVQNRLGLFSFGIYFLFVPLLAWVGADPAYVLALAAAIVACGGLAFWQYRWPEAAPPLFALQLLTNACLIGMFARLATPFLVAPGLAAATMLAFATHPREGKLVPMGLVLGSGVLVPWLLELTGVLSPSMFVRHGALVLDSPVVSTDLQHVAFVLAAYAVGLIGVVGLYARGMARKQRDAQRVQHVQAWQLRQLVPLA